MKRILISSSVLTLLILIMFNTQSSQAQESPLAVGDPAPVFEGPEVEGETWKSSDYVGEKVLVVYFYPAAMTGGCTKQACAFRDDRTRLLDLGAEVVGISGDNVEGLQVFKKAHRLNFPLVSDSEGKIAKTFGVPVKEGATFETEVDGKKVTLERGVTTARWTFIIDKDGKIAYVDTEVDAAGDSQNVLAALEEIQSN